MAKKPKPQPRKPTDNCTCLKCGNSWFSTKLYFEGLPPRTCPCCHRYDYLKPRIRKAGKKK